MTSHRTLESEAQSLIYPEDRLPFLKNLIAGFQHVIAMFGGTVLCPLLMGFDPNVAILFSGLSTFLFFLIVGGRIPSYLGSSFSWLCRRPQIDRAL